MPFKVLAIDGGGIRGVCPAALLSYIEERVDAPLHRYFDLIVGTSTGGIIALALSRGVPAAEVLSLYREKGETIFRRRYPFLPKRVALGLAGSLYRSAPLHEELKRVLGERTLLGEAACRVCIPTVNITTGGIEVLKTRHHEEFEHDHLLPMWRVAAATAAAPTYFSPVKLPERGYYVDGGVWANAPVMVGALEGVKLGHRPEDTRILSIGTGTTTTFCKKGAPKSGPFSHAPFSLNGWGTQLVELVMRAQTQRAYNSANYLLPAGQHFRVDFELPPGDCGLDAVHMTETLARRAFDKAKNVGHQVREQFFDAVAPPFTPVP